MWDKIFDWASDSKNLANAGQFVSPMISAWSAYKGADAIKDQNNILKSQYNRDTAIENMNNESGQDGFDQVFGTQNRKKKQLSDYAGTFNYQG